MDSKTKYNKLNEVIDSMTEDERKSLEMEIEKSLNSYTPTIPSLDEYANDVFKYRHMTLEERDKFARQSDNVKVKPDEKPEPFFYCNVGGIAPICSDCKRNHLNTIFRTEDIKNWYSPQYTSNFKICEGYIFNTK